MVEESDRLAKVACTMKGQIKNIWSELYERRSVVEIGVDVASSVVGLLLVHFSFFCSPLCTLKIYSRKLEDSPGQILRTYGETRRRGSPVVEVELHMYRVGLSPLFCTKREEGEHGTIVLV